MYANLEQVYSFVCRLPSGDGESRHQHVRRHGRIQTCAPTPPSENLHVIISVEREQWPSCLHNVLIRVVKK